MDFIFWPVFLKDKAKDLRRVAAATQGEMTVSDLESEAWLAAEHIETKRGEPIDFTNSQDQDAIIAKLYVNHVLRADKRFKFSTRFNRNDEDDNGGGWSFEPRDEEISDPLEQLIQREEEVAKQEEHSISDLYSQSTAYVIVLWHFDNTRTLAAAYLAIDRGTLRKRMAFANEILKIQPSLFDRIEIIDESFMPAPGRKYAVKSEPHYASEQWYWEF